MPKPSFMRTFFLLAALVAFCVASAQETDYTDLMKRYKKPLNGKPALPRFDALRSLPGKYQIYPSIPKTRLLGVLENRNTIYALPQDNMPCVVPDMSQFNMYNAAAGKVYSFKGPGAIPNPAAPPQGSIAFEKRP